MPTTVGTLTFDEPVDTYILIELPPAIPSVPTGGSVRVTLPAGIVSLASVSTCGTKPAWVSAANASGWGRFATFGIATPFDGTMWTTEPTSASPWAAGMERITEPGAIALLDSAGST